MLNWITKLRLRLFPELALEDEFLGMGEPVKVTRPKLPLVWKRSSIKHVTFHTLFAGTVPLAMITDRIASFVDYKFYLPVMNVATLHAQGRAPAVSDAKVLIAGMVQRWLLAAGFEQEQVEAAPLTFPNHPVRPWKGFDA